MRDTMDELREKLMDVCDSYSDFVDAMLNYASHSKEREVRLNEFLGTHSDAASSEVLRYVMSFADFYEDVDTEFSPQGYERAVG